MNPHQCTEKSFSISVKITPKDLEEFVILMEYFIIKVREEKGNIFYYVMKDCNEENRFIFWGLWQDDLSVQAHMNSAYFIKYVPQLGRLYEDFKVTELEKFL